MGIEQDLPPGEQLLPHLRRFIEHLVTSELSPKTNRHHVDNLWRLGGEIIRDLQYDKSWPSGHSQWLKRAAAFLRLHLPQAESVPPPTARRASISGYAGVTASPAG
jgi:hypothetical protein